MDSFSADGELICSILPNIPLEICLLPVGYTLDLSSHSLRSPAGIYLWFKPYRFTLQCGQFHPILYVGLCMGLASLDYLALCLLGRKQWPRGRWLWGVERRFSATTLAMVSYVVLIFSGPGGTLLLDEHITLAMLAGMTLIGLRLSWIPRFECYTPFEIVKFGWKLLLKKDQRWKERI